MSDGKIDKTVKYQGMTIYFLEDGEYVKIMVRGEDGDWKAHLHVPMDKK